MAVYADAEDLINVGAYVEGTNPAIDEAIDKIGLIQEFLRQLIQEKTGLEESLAAAARIVGIERSAEATERSAKTADVPRRTADDPRRTRMRRFAFRLENVLEIRKHLEQEWEIRLAKISGECMRLQARIAELDRERKESMQRRYDLSRIDMSDFTTRERYAERLLQTIGTLKNELTRREEERKEIGASLLEASRKRKTLDKLKERKAEEFRRNVNRSEIAVTDDIVQGRSARDAVTGD